MAIVPLSKYRNLRLAGPDADAARKAGMDLEAGARSLEAALAHLSTPEDVVIVEAKPKTVLYVLLYQHAVLHTMRGELSEADLKAMQEEMAQLKGNFSAIASRAWLQDVFDRAGVEELSLEFRALPVQKHHYPIVYDMGDQLFVGCVEAVLLN